MSQALGTSLLIVGALARESDQVMAICAQN
jgi:hypothetical protein